MAYLLGVGTSVSVRISNIRKLKQTDSYRLLNRSWPVSLVLQQFVAIP